MATQTQNINLSKPDLSESADIRVINANMDIIDHYIGNPDELVTDSRGNIVEAINEAAQRGGSDTAPYISESNGHWMVWNNSAGVYVDSGIKAQGTGLNIIDFFDTFAELEATITNPSVGDVYGIGTSIPYDIYVYGERAGWVNNGHLLGPEGPEGQQGPQGIQGEPGPQGPPGESLTQQQIVDLIYPVGSIHFSVTSANPGTYFGGTWVSWGTGRVPVGVDTSQTEFNVIEKTGGSKTHTLSNGEMPLHTHGLTQGYNYAAGGTSACVGYNTATSYSTAASGGGEPHNNLQPYITCYMWKRTA